MVKLYDIEINQNEMKLIVEINSKLSTIIVSKCNYTLDRLQKIRQNNFLVFVPHKICEDKIFGINVKLELNNVDKKYNGYILEDIEELNYFENFIDIDNENKAIIWIVINSMIKQYKDLECCNVTSYIKKEKEGFSIFGNSKLGYYQVIVSKVTYKFKDAVFNNGEDNIFIPYYCKDDNIYGFLIDIEIKENNNEDVLYDSFNKFPFEISFISPLELMILKGSISTEL